MGPITSWRDSGLSGRSTNQVGALYKTLTGNTEVSIEKTATNVCKKNDIECEAIGYDAIITVSNGNQIRKFKTSGNCGC